jgi:hypothetical protein
LAGAASPVSAAATIAASGPTALATSLAPWANDSSAVAKISGSTNSVLTSLRRFSSRAARAITQGRAPAQPRAKPASVSSSTISAEGFQSSSTISAEGFQTRFSPFMVR